VRTLFFISFYLPFASSSVTVPLPVHGINKHTRKNSPLPLSPSLFFFACLFFSVLMASIRKSYTTQQSTPHTYHSKSTIVCTASTQLPPPALPFLHSFRVVASYESHLHPQVSFLLLLFPSGWSLFASFVPLKPGFFPLRAVFSSVFIAVNHNYCCSLLTH
jgi:hypothetical protein